MKPQRPQRDSENLDTLLAGWPYAYGEVAARNARGADGRSVLLLRIDLGVLQIETTGRPDGERFDGHDTFLEYLIATAKIEGGAFELGNNRCAEVDREFVQFYHRRVAWLALREFEKAVDDANHTLALMDFSTAHAPNEEWVEMHEQYRPFVLFHKTQAEALAELERSDAESAVLLIDQGLQELEQSLAQLELEEDPIVELEDDDFVLKLQELRRSILSEYDLEASLSEQLADAVAREQYELAAELRDRIAGKRQQSSAPQK